MVASSIKIVQGEIADAMLKLYYFLIDKTQIALVIIALSFSFYVFIIFTINLSVSPHPTLIFGRIKQIAILQLKKKENKNKRLYPSLNWALFLHQLRHRTFYYTMDYTSAEDGRMDRQTEITKDDLTIAV
jgi:hypothetical protein